EPGIIVMVTRLFVGNLSYNVNEQELKEAFLAEGIEVRSVKVALDRESGRPRGFAFVETMTDEGAKQSIEKLSGKMLQGRTIVVEEAQARAAGPRPGGGPGGPPRPGGFGAGPPRPGGFSGGPPRPGGFGPPRMPPHLGAAPPRGGERDARGGAERRERPETKRSS